MAVEPIKPCCESWNQAQQAGSDNEGHGALVYRRYDNGQIEAMGCDLPPIRFCPWCGAKKQAALTTVSQRKYDDLPRGARFRYVGHADYGIWVKLENGGTGVIAHWEGVDSGVGLLQSICSLCETDSERETFIVEVVE